MKLANGLMCLAVLLVMAVGLGGKYWLKGDGWNVFVAEVPAEEAFKPLNEFIAEHKNGKYPAWRDVADFARKEIPYIMVYYSYDDNGYQTAFWNGEYSWIYNSADGRVYRMTEDVSRTAWYDAANQQLLTSADVEKLNAARLEEAGKQKNMSSEELEKIQLKYARL